MEIDKEQYLQVQGRSARRNKKRIRINVTQEIENERKMKIMMKFKVTEEAIEKLLEYVAEEPYAHRWTTDDGKQDRIYIDNAAFGLVEWYSNSGFHHAALDDLSHNKSRKYISCKNYIDLKSGEVKSVNRYNWEYNFQKELEELVRGILEGGQEANEE